MNQLHSLVLAITLLVGNVSTVAAQDYEKAYEAHGTGDYQTALTEWRPLAEQGDARAQNGLGYMYDNGQGVPQDYTEAIKWFRRAAEQGYDRAQNNLGIMYDLGKGVPQDSAEAVKWYRLAAEQGYDLAQNNLGFKYDSGQGVRQDSAEAVKWYRLAAEQGVASAQINLGFMFHIPPHYSFAQIEPNGALPKGVLQSNVMAYMWFSIAAANGSDRAGKLRDELERTGGLMTNTDISKAQKLARECMNSNYQNCGS